MATLRLPLLPLLFSYLLSFAAGEIKTLEISDDSRTTILFEKFGFARGGGVYIAVSSASFSAPDASLLGFFLLSDESIFQALLEAEQQQPPDDPNLNPNPNPNPNPGCALLSPYVTPLFSFRDLPLGGAAYNLSFPVTHPDEYSLYFANCAGGSSVSMSVRTEMYNPLPGGGRDYLSVGQAPVPAVFATFAAAYLAFLAAWLFLTLFIRRVDTHLIHHLMSGLLLARALYLLSAAEDQHFVRTTGTPHGWDVPFYLFRFLKGVLLFAVIVLVGAGWSFLKPFLHDREKKVLAAVIPLQVAANVAAAVVGETGPFLQAWVTWNQVFLLVDVACCCAVLFPTVWSIRTLRETSKTDGKAARNLAKLTLFRQFYTVVIGYLYFTRIIVYALKTISSYKYLWVSVVADETATLVFFVFMFNMFRPAERNQYFVLDEEEEAAEAALREEEFEL